MPFELIMHFNFLCPESGRKKWTDAQRVSSEISLFGNWDLLSQFEIEAVSNCLGNSGVSSCLYKYI